VRLEGAEAFERLGWRLFARDSNRHLPEECSTITLLVFGKTLEGRQSSMGYDFHITRKENWFDEGDDISLEELKRLVEQDASLSFDPDLGENMIRFTGESKYDDPWLEWDRGRISTKWPDRKLIEKMIKISRSLGANVQGDEGERYESPGDIPPSWDSSLGL